MPEFTQDSPCQVKILPGDKGGMLATFIIPTYSGGVALTFEVERDADGDWRVFLPDVSEYLDVTQKEALAAECEPGDGILLYLGAPDVPVERKV